MGATIVRHAERGSQVSALIARGAKFREKGKLPNALRAADDAIALDPGSAEAFLLRATVLADLDQPFPAFAACERVIALNPGCADAHGLKGLLVGRDGNFAEALRSFERALAIAPGLAGALHYRALALRELGRKEEALAAFDALIERLPDQPGGHFERALLLADMGRDGEALAGFERTLTLQPQHVEALCNCATALTKLRRLEEALDLYRQALALAPDNAGVLFNLGEACAMLRRYDEAEPHYRSAITLQPDLVEAHQSLGMILAVQRRFLEALKCYQAAVAIDVNRFATLQGFANALYQSGYDREALVILDHVAGIASDNALIHEQRGILLFNLRRDADAIENFDRARALDPRRARSAMRLHAAMRLARWDDFDRLLDDALCEQRGESCAPEAFVMLALMDDPALHLDIARRYAGAMAPSMPQPHARHDRIRIGYFSADFHNHATMHLFIETLEAHDRARFEVVGFALNGVREDAWRRRASAAFDRFVDVSDMPDEAVARLAREMEIDIAIDLKGFTQENRFRIFAERAAPVQAAYLGYPGTSGSECIDYLIADPVLIPDRCRSFYSEKIIYLPGSYQPNTALRPVARAATRAVVGLPEDAVVFASFNQVYKVLPQMFDSWMQVLREVPDSVLWQWGNGAEVGANLKREAAVRGVDPGRIVLAESALIEAHIDRLGLADLFLDAFPCNGHTTASDALRAGLPLLTCAGNSFASRVAASLLEAVGLGDLVTSDLESYRALAIELGQDRERLAAIRARLARNRETSTLFDPVSAARKLEAGFSEIYEIHRSGQAPRDIRVRC